MLAAKRGGGHGGRGCWGRSVTVFVRGTGLLCVRDRLRVGLRSKYFREKLIIETLSLSALLTNYQ